MIKSISAVALCFVVSVVQAGIHEPLAVAPIYDADGLRSLQVNGREILADGAVTVARVRTADTYRNPFEMPDPYVKDERTFADASIEVREKHFDPTGRRLTQAFDWGRVAVTYADGPGRLDLQIAVHNTSGKVIEQIVMDLITLQVPARGPSDRQFLRVPWNKEDNIGAPVLSVVQPEVVHFQRVAFPPAVDEVLMDLLGDAEWLAPETETAPIRTLCMACYPRAATAHLMETKQQVVPMDRVVEGVCAQCGAETQLNPEAKIVAGTLQGDQPLTLQFMVNGAEHVAGRDLHRVTSPGTVMLRITAGNEKAPEVYDGVWNVRPIKPGATEIIEVGVRFGRADESDTVVGADFLEPFGLAHPPVLKWPDRRPIGMVHLTAETDWGHGGNPRGWWALRDNDANINTPEGRAIFEKWIMAYADQLIGVADKAGSQGVIVWDLEGKQYPGVAYYGDPRIMQYTAPEMEVLADAFFKKLTDAGLRVGVCIRPHQVYPKAVPDSDVEKYGANGFAEMPYHETWEHFNIQSFGLEFWGYGELGLREHTPLRDIKRCPVARLDAIITYSKERWGATLFYIDTNHFKRSREKRGPNAAGGHDILHNWYAALMRAQQWEELQRRHPDCLLIPEHEYTQYWTSTAPYRQPPHDGVTPDFVRAIYPEAFSGISMGERGQELIEKGVDAYTRAIEAGDLLMTLAWFGPPQVLLDIYAKAAESAPVRVELDADGGLRLQGHAVHDLETLGRLVAEQVRGKPFAERRTVVHYAHGVSRQSVANLLVVLQQADAIIAWSRRASE